MKFRTRIAISLMIIMTVPFLLAGILYVSSQLWSRMSGSTEPDMLYQALQSPAAGQVRGAALDLLVSVLLILVLTATILLSWIYGSMMPKISQLTAAADRIKEGDLNFSVASDGDDEFSELCNAFEEMRLRLAQNAQEKLESEQEQRMLLSNIAHDLKTPITVVRGYAEGLLDGVADTPQKQENYLRTIYGKAAEMDTLLNELSLYSRIDTNRMPYHFQQLSICAYFDERAESLSAELLARGIAFAYSNGLSPQARFIVDPEQLSRVIANVISNSVKYMDSDEGRVSLLVRSEGEELLVEIADNGRGISPEDLPHIFERTYRADASRNAATGGSGLGLSIAKKIVEDHGGRIWARSHEGQGTTICLALRWFADPDAAVALMPEEPEPTERLKRRRGAFGRRSSG